MKTCELSGKALNWAVSICEGDLIYNIEGHEVICDQIKDGLFTSEYSTNWKQAGAIIEREFIQLMGGYDGAGNRGWCAQSTKPNKLTGWISGETALIAAMRCFVVSRVGEDIEIPEELTC
jgi:hypothetical protein